MASSASRPNVQVELRDSTSMLLDCKAVKRSFAESGTYATLEGSLKIAAASARQKSTSKPTHWPCSPGAENPSKPWLTPQIKRPRSFTDLSVCAGTAVAPKTMHASTATNLLAA